MTRERAMLIAQFFLLLSQGFISIALGIIAFRLLGNLQITALTFAGFWVGVLFGKKGKLSWR